MKHNHNDDRNKMSAINVCISLFSQLLIVFSNFISRTFFIKYLINEYLGINGLFSNILNILSFAELGIGEVLIFSMYKPYKENDILQLKKLMNFYKVAYRYITVIVFITGILITFFLDLIIIEKPNIHENIKFIFILYLFNIVVSYLLTYKKSILFVAQKRYIVIFFQTITIIVQTLLQILALLLTHSYILFLVIQILCSLLNNVLISLYVNKKYSYLSNNKEHLSKNDKKNIFNNVKSLSIAKLAGIVGTSTDNIIASKLIGLSIVGLSSNYTMLINGINGLLWSILNGLTNSIGNFNVDSSTKQRKEIFYQLYLCTFWLFFVSCICIGCLINPFVKIWIGEHYLLSRNISFALLFSVFIGGLNYPAYSYRVSLGLFKEVQLFYIGYVVVNIILSIMLGKIWGIFGIFIATPISRLLTAEVGDGYYVYKVGLNEKPIKYFLLDLFSILIFIISYVLLNAIIEMIKIKGLIGLLVKGIVIFIICNIIVFLIAFKTDSLKRLLSRLKRMLITRSIQNKC